MTEKEYLLCFSLELAKTYRQCNAAGEIKTAEGLGFFDCVCVSCKI